MKDSSLRTSALRVVNARPRHVAAKVRRSVCRAERPSTWHWANINTVGRWPRLGMQPPPAACCIQGHGPAMVQRRRRLSPPRATAAL
eukprot:5850862-Alexandrium_andersonii.AAC.1